MKIRQFTFSYSREKWAIFFNLRFAAQNTFKCGYEDINGNGGKFLGNVCAPTEVATRLPFVLFRNYWQKKRFGQVAFFSLWQFWRKWYLIASFEKMQNTVYELGWDWLEQYQHQEYPLNFQWAQSQIWHQRFLLRSRQTRTLWTCVGILF